MPIDNPYSAPDAELVESDEAAAFQKIESPEVSDKWKQRFRAIAQAGGPKLPDLKTLSKTERRNAMGFNILAFLFGPVYYAFKGMWRRGLSLLLICVVVIFSIAFIMVMLGLDEYIKHLSYGASAIYAIRANIDYYKHIVLDDYGWF